MHGVYYLVHKWIIYLYLNLSEQLSPCVKVVCQQKQCASLRLRKALCGQRQHVPSASASTTPTPLQGAPSVPTGPIVFNRRTSAIAAPDDTVRIPRDAACMPPTAPGFSIEMTPASLQQYAFQARAT